MSMRRLQDPAPDLVQQAVEIAAKWAGIPVEKVRSASHVKPSVLARNAVALGLQRGGGYSTRALSRALRHEATLVYGMKEASDLALVDASYSAVVRSITALAKSHVVQFEDRIAQAKVKTTKVYEKKADPLVAQTPEVQKERILRLKRRGWSVNGIARHFEVDPSVIAKVVGVQWGAK